MVAEDQDRWANSAVSNTCSFGGFGSDFALLGTMFLHICINDRQTRIMRKIVQCCWQLPSSLSPGP